jgi:hypothetical protein
MIYTCYEMIQDCRAGRAEGWTYFVEHYAPVIGRLLEHYFAERDAALIERMVAALHDGESTLFASLDPAPERNFVAALRQEVLRLAETGHASAAPEIPLELETLGAALEPLTVTEKLVVWLETMRYPSEDAGRMLRMAPTTAEAIRSRAAELLRGSLDTWSRNLLEANGAPLGRAAAALASKDCLPAKAFMDVIDGRATWRGREDLERHVKNCWHCLDHFCRLLEVVDVLRGAQPLAAAEVARYQQLLGIQASKRRFWRKAPG